MTTATVINIPERTKDEVRLKIPLPIHLACILLLVAVTVCTGPLAAFFA
jgi:hypothetical protein